MKKILQALVVIICTFVFIGCQWPKVFVRSSSGYVSYDRLSHRLEIIWESTTQTPADSTGLVHK